MNEKRELRIRSIYDLGLALKALASAVEILSGIAVLFVSRNLVAHIADIATAGELAEDPHDFVANFLRDTAHTFALHAHYALAAYLLLRGLVKIVLIILILRGVKAAYPLFIIALAFFGWYEAYKAVLDVNYWLGAVAVFDTGLILLTAYEYKRRGYSSQV
jgi:uncharacterized membrane protein